MPTIKAPLRKFNSKAKKLACVGGVLVLAGASAWGLVGSRKDVVDDNSAKVPEVPQTEIITMLPEVKKEEQEQPKESEQPKALTLKTHVVKTGDTLSAIADNYSIDIDTILSANPQVSELIYPGEELKILPGKGVVYQVKAGDTLWRISRDYEVTVESIVKENQKPSDQIIVGETIFIPGARYSRIDRSELRAQPVVSRGTSSRLIWPVSGELSSPFGWRWGRFHSGIDIANEIGAPVVAAGAGQVIWAGSKGGYGYAVMIRHNNGMVTLYGHLNDYFVEKGQYVRAGQRIASVGNTGNSTGPHLHFEVLRNDDPVNPMEILP